MSIDWSRKTTPESREAERLANWRASTTRSRLEIAESLIALDILTEDEAEEFSGHQLPKPLDDMTKALPKEISKQARRMLRGASQFDRAHPMWEHAPYDADTVDAIFGRDIEYISK